MRHVPNVTFDVKLRLGQVKVRVQRESQYWYGMAITEEENMCSLHFL